MDAVETARGIGIDPGRAVDYCCDSQGISLNYEVLSKAICSVRCGGRLDDSWKQRIEDDSNLRR